jgi:hypothetical protein
MNVFRTVMPATKKGVKTADSQRVSAWDILYFMCSYVGIKIPLVIFLIDASINSYQDKQVLDFYGSFICVQVMWELVFKKVSFLKLKFQIWRKK